MKVYDVHCTVYVYVYVYVYSPHFTQPYPITTLQAECNRQFVHALAMVGRISEMCTHVCVECGFKKSIPTIECIFGHIKVWLHNDSA